ncbi:MAG: polysaccharide pyruvyl transferase family protein [Synergistaceae bacterium]|jgi:polysaccharide pyruvyl transferase CsaB|nr:polysaccharide pyruvyl transferase family protein [Synergistaceae bacterium]
MWIYPRRREFDVLMAGYFGFGNLGDELLASVSIFFLNECGVSSDKIAILSGDPEGSSRRLGIDAFDRWKLGSVMSALRRSRSLLFAGGGLFQDATSIRSSLYYWGVARIARMCSCAVWALGQSVGPLARQVSKSLARDALRSCRYLAVRDTPSLCVSRELGLSPEVMPDIVMGMKTAARCGRAKKTVLLNARPVHGRAESADMFAEAARECAGMGFDLRGIAFAREDVAALEEIRDRYGVPMTEIRLAESAAEFLDEANNASIAVGMRLHFAILSLKAGLEVVMFPYDPKVSAFVDEWGMSVINNCTHEKKTGNFDIMTLLKNITNKDKRDKKDMDEVHTCVARHFRKGLGLVLEGEDR